MAESSAAAQERSQYHHFVPRFILRNYSHLGEAPNAPRPRNRKGKGRNGPRVTEPMLYGINLSGEEPEITETPVAKTFGMIDMYRDVNASAKQHQIEEQLSVLESRAGEVISTIRKAFEAGKEDVWITRTQRDILRKFLFIMKYRGKRFHKRFFHEKADDYNANDRERMLKYMKEKGFTRPIDVWFDNIKGILDLKMDPELAWMEKIQKRIYPDDAKWFCNNVQQFYMALITPKEPENEFLLTQNAYGIHEGYETEQLNPLTGNMECTAYTEFHLFAPISPRLMIVLRTIMLPVPEEDADASIREWRESFYQANAIQHDHPEHVGNLLRNLPIGKARNSYSEIIDGTVIRIHDRPLGPSDKFGFRFFPIPVNYVQTINRIMLQESYNIDMIVFNNKAATYKTLQNYLEGCSLFGLDSPRLQGVKKLREVAKLLAEMLPPEEPNIDPDAAIEDKVPEDKLHILFTKDQKMKDIYMKLSEKPLDSKDFEQARGLLYMRIKLDSATRGLPNDVRETARNNFLDLYHDLPVQVVWIYLKRIRFMKMGCTKIGLSNEIEDSILPAKYLHGFEDVIAISRGRFREKRFCHVMHHASFNGSLLAKPIWGLVEELTLDDNGMQRLHEEKDLVLGPQGSIADCGIPVLEEAATAAREVVKLKLLKNWKHPLDAIFTEEDKIEMMTRNILKGFKDEETGAGFLDDPELEKVIFDVVYPSFGSRQKKRYRSAEVEDLMDVVNGTGEVKDEQESGTWGSKCLVQ